MKTAYVNSSGLAQSYLPFTVADYCMTLLCSKAKKVGLKFVFRGELTRKHQNLYTKTFEDIMTRLLGMT